MIGKVTKNTFVLLFLAACASFSNAQSRTPADFLFEHEVSYPAQVGSWYLNATGPSEANATAADEILVTIPFNATAQRIIGAFILDENCTNPFDPPESVYTNSSIVKGANIDPTFMQQTMNGEKPPFKQYYVYMTSNITRIRQNGNKWVGDTTTGTFTFCLRQEMLLEIEKDDEDSPNVFEVIHFLENKVSVTVDLDASFSVTSVVSRDAAKQEEVRVDYSDYVTAYECVESDLVNKANGQEYSQGDELKICVKSKDPTIVQVGGIQRLTLSQDDDATDDDFTYINGGNPVSSEIAATTCDKTITPAHVCHADMQLLGRYFEDESPGELTATGSVKLSFPDGSTSRRLTVDVPIASGIRGGDLALENSARRMEEEKPDDSPFDVTVSLKSLVESGSDYYGVSLVSGLVAAAGGAILMV